MMTEWQLQQLWAFHKRRSRADEISEHKRRWHRKQASNLSAKLKLKKRASFNWRELCEAYSERW